MKQKLGGSSATPKRTAARTALVAVVAGLCLFVLFGTGPMGALAQVVALQTTGTPTESPSGSPTSSPSESPTEEPTESPSPTPSVPSGPTVVLINPAIEHEPPFGVVGPAPETPKISEKFDGRDETYHLVAITKQAPQNATVEAYWTPSGGAEVSIGSLTRLEDRRDTWELHWDVPDTLSGDGTVTVKLFNGASAELSTDSEDATIDHAEETVEIGWPTNGGQLGWHKPRGGAWRAVVEGTASQSAQRVYVMYTTSAIGTQPEYKNCTETGFIAPPAPPAGTTFRTWSITCELEGKDTPADLTGIAATASETDNPAQPGGTGFVTGESSDAHRVVGYMQEPALMNVTIAPVQPATTSAAYPTAEAQQAGNDCLEFDVTVTDHLDRPVQGANVDIHLRGPSDEAGFGDEASAANGSSADKVPDAGNHETEAGWDCDSPGDRIGEQGEHEDPTANDLKHVESTAGTGLSGPTGIRPGQFRFHLFSPDPGRTNLTAWVDDKPLKNQANTRAQDNDELDEAEPSAATQAQWLAGPATVRLNPASATFISGECSPVTVQVRGGRTRIEGANIDIHATGPSSSLDFCTPPDAADTRAPDLGGHDEEDEHESTHPPASEGSPTTQHTEGETDDSGTFVIGLLSTSDGDTTLQAWIDGTKGQDNDAPATSEPTADGTYAWASSVEDATVRFLNPSGYGDGAGDNVSVQQDANGFFHIVTRVDVPDLVTGVDILISDNGTSFSKLGDAARVGQSEVFQFQWSVGSLPDGAYTLRAQIEGTEKVDDREITIDKGLNTVELTDPGLNGVAAFVEQKATIAGVASAAATGATFYYTTTAPRDPNEAETWTECGSVTLEGTGDAPQQFQGECTLAEGDQPGTVTGIAAIADTCDPDFGCPDDTPLGALVHETGDAHRVFGFDTQPIVGISPTKGEGAKGTCQRILIDVEDQSGGSIPNADVDIHLDGPSENVHFCDPEGQSDNRSAPEEGQHTPVSGQPDEAVHQNSDTVHTEGRTGSNGRFVVGIVSKAKGKSRLTVWVDQTENDTEDDAESAATTTFTWVDAGRCTQSGTAGDDVLRGTSGNDRLCGLGGDDVIEGRGGRDVLVGGGGRDILRGESDADAISGGAGADTLVGGGGNDSLRGGNDQDALAGKGGRDTLRGGANNDTLKGGEGSDRCFGGGGSDEYGGCEQQQ